MPPRALWVFSRPSRLGTSGRRCNRVSNLERGQGAAELGVAAPLEVLRVHSARLDDAGRRDGSRGDSKLALDRPRPRSLPPLRLQAALDPTPARPRPRTYAARVRRPARGAHVNASRRTTPAWSSVNPRLAWPAVPPRGPRGLRRGASQRLGVASELDRPLSGALIGRARTVNRSSTASADRSAPRIGRIPRH